jgi:hypothetical protein
MSIHSTLLLKITYKAFNFSSQMKFLSEKGAHVRPNLANRSMVSQLV